MSREAALYHSPALRDQPAWGKGAISLDNGSSERAYHHVGVLGRPFRVRYCNADPIPRALPRAVIERPFGPPSLRVPRRQPVK
jgi:hypothetical protein